jgi:biotin transporter BioY
VYSNEIKFLRHRIKSISGRFGTASSTLHHAYQFAYPRGFGNSKLKRILFGLLGVVICHLIGIIWICFIAKISFLAAFLGASAPFIIKDILCVLVALFAANRVKKEITL